MSNKHNKHNNQNGNKQHNDQNNNNQNRQHNNEVEKMAQQNPVANPKQGCETGQKGQACNQKPHAGAQQQGGKAPHQAQSNGKKPEVSGSHDIKKMSTHDHQNQGRGCTDNGCTTDNKNKDMKGGGSC